MRILFTKNKTPGSLLIRFGTGDSKWEMAPHSHVAILFDDSLVFHSTLSSGVHLQWLDKFKESRTIVNSLEPQMDLALPEEEAIYQDIINTYKGRKYDISGTLFLAWRFFLKKFFDKPMPTRNELGDDSALFCTELVDALSNEFCTRLGINLYSKTIDPEMLDPYTLYKLLVESGKVKESAK